MTARQRLVALLPALPFLGWLGWLGLRWWRDLPAGARGLTVVFAVTQLLAACLTPSPGLSLGLALARTALVVGLISFGARLPSRVLHGALLGFSVVGVTAVVTTLLTAGDDALGTRLVHPYYTTVSVGLAGATALLLALTWRDGPRGWRWLGGGIGLTALLWSGSRGALLLLACGGLAALLTGGRRQARVTAAAGLGVGAALALVQATFPLPLLSRFLEGALLGRGAYWWDALAAWRLWPWGGVGPYQLGPFLSTQYNPGSCRLWLPAAQGGGDVCPAWLDPLRGAWLIAHNGAFHFLGETGVIGTLGWLLLLGYVGVQAWRGRDPVVNALFWGYVAMSLVDNPLLLPNLGGAELFWLSAGVAIRQAAARPVPGPVRPLPGWAVNLTPASLLGAAVLALWMLPLWADASRPAPQAPRVQLLALGAPPRFIPGVNSSVFAGMRVSGGPVEVRVLLCQPECRAVVGRAEIAPGEWWGAIGVAPIPAKTTALELQAVRVQGQDSAALALEPSVLFAHRWEVTPLEGRRP